MNKQDEMAVSIALNAWNSQMQSANKIFNNLTDEKLMTEIAPGRNRGVYLLGHLVAVHDALLEILGLEKKSYPQLEKPFLHTPDKTVTDIPSVQELKKYWKDNSSKIDTHFKKMSPDSWYQKHESVSAEDFAKEPHRNKLNVLTSRTNHLAYHTGQLALLR